MQVLLLHKQRGNYMLTFDHSVKFDGKWFKAGEPVDFPVLTPAKKEQVVEDDATETAEKVEKPAPAKRSYTKRK